MRKIKVSNKLLFGLVVSLVIGSLLLSLSYLFANPILILEKEKLGQDELIQIQIEAKDAIYLGDVTSYKIKILYNFREIEIDKASLDQINFKPFEVRDWKERETYLDSKTKVYQREYEIQLIEGQTNQLYNFTNVTLRYRERESEEWLEKDVILQPIFISSRLPDDVSGLELKPPKGKVQDFSAQITPWVFFGEGILSILGGLVGLLTILKKKRKKLTLRRKHYLLETCEALKRRLELGEDPKLICHQIFQVLMVSLAGKEEIDWLKLELPKLSKEIKDEVKILFEKCQRGYRPEPIERKEVKEMISNLQEIVKFCLKRRKKNA